MKIARLPTNWIKRCVVSVGLTALSGLSVHAEALKIGLLESLSGTQTTSAELVKNAVDYVFGDLNARGGVNGAPVNFKAYKAAVSVDEAVSRLNEMIGEGARIVLIVGSSNITVRISEEIGKYNQRNPAASVLLFNVYSESLDLTGEKCSFHHFRFMTTAPMRVNALVEAMKSEGSLGNRVFALNPNYSWGQDVQEATANASGKMGYEVVARELHAIGKIGEGDAIVAKLKAANATSVITGSFNDDLLVPIKAVRDAKLPIRFGATFLDQPGNVGKLGEAAEGNYVAHPFNIEADKTSFTADYKAKTGRVPVYIEPQTIFALRALEKALTPLNFGGGPMDMNKVAIALEGVEVPTPIGVIKVRREDHQAVMPVVVSRVSRNVRFPVDGTSYGFELVKVVPAETAIYPVQASCKMQRPAS